MAMLPRLCTHQPQPQGEYFVPLAGGFHVLHQPANGLDALLIAVEWLGDAGCLGHDRSVANLGSGTATATNCQSGEPR